MSTRVHITGMGIISAIGDSVDESFRSLSGCRTGIAPIQFLKTTHANTFMCGEVKHSNAELNQLAGTSGYNRTTTLGLIAAREAMKQAGINPAESARGGFISSTTVAGMCHTELVYKDFFDKKTNENFIDTHFSGASTDAIAGHLGITGFVSTISTACSSAANAVMLGARLIKNGQLDYVVVGGVDALSKFTLNGFNTLMILDTEWCKPFDENRKGLNLGEGAAYLVLESEEQIKKHSKKSLGRVSGYANTNDAFHQTASSPEGYGAFLAMQKALQVAGLSASQIDYINAHGTGTPNNDASEGMAMQGIFGNTVPKFSSTKAYTGHTLAAAAAIEAVISILSMQEEIIFPCLNQSEQMKELHISPVTVLEKQVSMKHVMSNSFGFGGNCSTLIFSNN